MAENLHSAHYWCIYRWFMGMPDKLPRLIGSHDHQIHSQQLPAKAITGVAAVAKKASDDDPMLAEELQKNVFMLLLGDIHDLLSSAGAIAPPKWPPIRNGENWGKKHMDLGRSCVQSQNSNGLKPEFWEREAKHFRDLNFGRALYFPV